MLNFLVFFKRIEKNKFEIFSLRKFSFYKFFFFIYIYIYIYFFFCIYFFYFFFFIIIIFFFNYFNIYFFCIPPTIFKMKIINHHMILKILFCDVLISILK